MLCKIDVVQRNGTDHMIARDTSLTTDASCFKITYHYQNVAPVVNSILDGAVNSNWRIVKSLLDPTLNKFIGDTLQKSALQPIFDEVSLQDMANDFFDMNSTCENIPENK